MKYYLDTEFCPMLDKLISLALVREDRRTLYIVFKHEYVKDPWVKENVIPILFDYDPRAVDHVAVNCDANFANTQLAVFFKDDDTPVHIIADHPADFRYLCLLMDMRYSNPPGMEVLSRYTMEVINVDSWPNDIEGAVQHNAVWDALALRDVLCFERTVSLKDALAGVAAPTYPDFDPAKHVAKKWGKCGTCRGTGKVYTLDSSSYSPCPACDEHKPYYDLA